MDADGQHSALFACIAEMFQHLDIEVVTAVFFAKVEQTELNHDTSMLVALFNVAQLC